MWGRERKEVGGEGTGSSNGHAHHTKRLSLSTTRLHWVSRLHRVSRLYWVSRLHRVSRLYWVSRLHWVSTAWSRLDKMFTATLESVRRSFLVV